MKELGTNWQFQSSHRDINYGTKNTVDNVVITMPGASWALEISFGFNSSIFPDTVNISTLLVSVNQGESIRL